MSGLTRSIQDRLFIGILSLVFGPFTGWLLYERTKAPGNLHPHDDWVLWCLYSVIAEGIAAVFLVSVFGLIWALFTPNWVEKLLRKAFSHFLLAVIGVGVVVMIMMMLAFAAYNWHLPI